MIEIILLIVGIVYAVRRPKLKRLAPADYPSVEPSKFIEWQLAQLKAINIFLLATWGAFGVKLLLMGLLSAAGGVSQDAALAFIAAILLAWIVGLVIASIYGSKAKTLATAVGIKWP